jgi:mono/diheme cytochrome c family protein
LNHLRLFTAPLPETNIPTYSKLVALTDSRASVEQRARSYLDANCASCHRPGGARAEFDARYDTPLAQQNLIDGKLIAADLGIADAVTLKPGDPEHSMIFQRMKRRHDAFNMPPLASQIPDKEALKVLEEWIKGLPRK